MSEPEEKPSATGPVDADADAREGSVAWVKIAGVMALLAGGVGYLLLGTGGGDAFVYSKLVHEIMADPDAYRDRELRVEGDLRQGSVQFREDPCEWRFVLEKEGRSMPVAFPQCVVPDTFRDTFGIQVTVQGRLEDDGTFLANQVIPRCPSKYEMQERLEAGEAAPHPDVVPTAGFGSGG